MQTTQTLTQRGLIALALVIVLASYTALAAGRPDTVTVSAGTIDRHHSIVTFPADPASAGSFQELAADGGGAMLPLEVRPDGTACFILPELKAGQSRTYRIALVKRSEDPKPAMTATQKAGAIVISTAVGKDVLIYRGEKTPLPPKFEPQYARGGYIEPLLTPAGVRVSDDYPPNHKHHHGVWAPWTHTEFEGRKPDFWNMGGKTGSVEFVEFGKSWGSRVEAGFTAKHCFLDLSAKPEPKTALNETWQVSAYAIGAGQKEPPKYNLFDWQSTQTCATDSPLLLPKYYYGGLGFRGSRQWDGADGCTMVTSEGKTRQNGNETTAKWMAIAGKVDGKPAYVAILCSPGNFRFPQPVRLHPKEPFVCWAPQQAGDMKIEPGKPYVMKYRFVVGDGELDKAQIDRLWEDYANPVKVEAK
jgi:hypothetical protein